MVSCDGNEGTPLVISLDLDPSQPDNSRPHLVPKDFRGNQKILPGWDIRLGKCPRGPRMEFRPALEAEGELDHLPGDIVTTQESPGRSLQSV